MKTLRIFQEQDAENPREWDNAGRMLCWHNRYNLGDKNSYDSDNWLEELACEADDDLADKLESLEQTQYTYYSCARVDAGYSFSDALDYANVKYDRVKSALIDKVIDEHYLIAPLYLYDHSGLAMSTGSFSCPWDSGCVGVYVLTAEEIEAEFGGCWEKARKYVDAVVETYSQWLGGDVCGYIAEDEDGEFIDSCTGFYGSDPETNGMKDHIDLDDYEVIYE